MNLDILVSRLLQCACVCLALSFCQLDQGQSTYHAFKKLSHNGGLNHHKTIIALEAILDDVRYHKEGYWSYKLRPDAKSRLYIEGRTINHRIIPVKTFSFPFKHLGANRISIQGLFLAGPKNARVGWFISNPSSAHVKSAVVGMKA